MKLTKKDRAAGHTENDKLRKHMKSLHDREQTKRINRMQNSKKKGGKKMKLSEKEMIKYKKYQAAQVGLKKAKIKVTKSGQVKKVNAPPNNDLFTILKEMSGVTVQAKDNVDEAIILRASQWMNKTTKHQNETGQPQFYESNNWNGQGCRGVLVIYSMDADFVPLLQKAKKKGFVTVSMDE